MPAIRPSSHTKPRFVPYEKFGLLIPMIWPRSLIPTAK